MFDLVYCFGIMLEIGVFNLRISLLREKRSIMDIQVTEYQA